MPNSIWENYGAAGQNLSPPSDVPAGVPSFNAADVPPTPVVESGFKGLPVRCGGDRVFLLKNGKKYWFANAEAFAKAGFKFGDEKEIDQISLALFPEGEPIK